ncbi:MAG TPA: cytochrome c oxidase assembly protein [Actinomycetota bacterium]|nr:cytochrome c oxidase assembly protein [Actinomycetota bacterium]
MPDPAVTWHAHPEVWALVAGLAGGYLWALRRVGRRHVSPGDRPASTGQVVSFLLGVAAVWVAADWPVHEISEERLFSVHMTQHLLLSLVAPPLLLLGTPGWLFRTVVRPRWLLGTVRWLARPLVALLLFNGFIALSHWPAVVQLSVSWELAHLALHAVLVGTALLMWMPVLSPVAEIPRLSYPGQMLYLFAQSIVPTVPASFLTFGTSPLYPFYAIAAPLAGMDPVTDQRIAGLIMKLLGGFILWGVIAVLFFRWHAQEEATGEDAPVWEDVERALHRIEVQR